MRGGEREDEAGSMEEDEKKNEGSSYKYWVREATSDAAPPPLPRKLTPSDIALTHSSNPPALGSLWNRAGTWEEKSLTKWATDRLKELLVSVGSLEFSSGMAEIKDVSRCVGDAFLVTVRNKKRVGYSYELSLKVEGDWTFEDNKKKVKGTLEIPEFSLGELDELQVDVRLSEDNLLQQQKQRICLDLKQFLEPIRLKLRQFEQELKDTLTVKMESASIEEARMEQFPVGMRVLAVDDNPTCLRKLEELLLRCKYHVTTTKEAKAALEMLREKSNKFDLVISDVEMPDMDGFKLLELVGLEMDLPVIMLSAHSDYEHVMKGITHGACDYLVKPVGLKELRNIWQHVVRNNTSPYARNTVGPSRQLLPPSDSLQTSRVCKKRKGSNQDSIDDDDEDNDSDGEEEGGEGSEHDMDESCTRKKPRVVWASELHQKFVAAVTQLGPDKAVPKKILDLMNVEGLTRENVASHLQKYRLYLKKMDEAHQHHMTPSAYGTKDPSFLHMAQLDGFKDFHSLTATRQLPISTLLSRPHAPIVTRLNSPTRSLINLQGITSPSFVRPGQYQNMSSSTNMPGKYHSPLLSGVQNVNSFQRTSPPLEASQFPSSKYSAYMGDSKILGDHAIGSSFLDSRASLGSSSSTCLASASSNSLLLQAKYQQQPLQRILGGNQSSLQGGPSNSGSLDVGVHGLSSFSSHSRCSESWQGNVKTPKFPLNPLPHNHSLSRNEMLGSNNNFRGIEGNGHGSVDFNPFIYAENPGGEMQSQTNLSGNFVQNMNASEQQQNWEEQGRDCSHMLNDTFSNIDVLVPANDMVMDIINAAGNKGLDGSLMSQIDGSAVLNSQHVEVGKAARLEAEMRSTNKGCSLEQTKTGNGFMSEQQDTFDDMMNEMMKQDETMASGFGLDSFPLP